MTMDFYYRNLVLKLLNWTKKFKKTPILGMNRRTWEEQAEDYAVCRSVVGLRSSLLPMESIPSRRPSIVSDPDGGSGTGDASVKRMYS